MQMLQAHVECRSLRRARAWVRLEALADVRQKQARIVAHCRDGRIIVWARSSFLAEQVEGGVQKMMCAALKVHVSRPTRCSAWFGVGVSSLQVL